LEPPFETQRKRGHLFVLASGGGLQTLYVTQRDRPIPT
jgi:hypothetical protein